MTNTSKVLRFTCWFSARFWNVHDYHVNRGGTGYPDHFQTFECWNCGMEFRI